MAVAPQTKMQSRQPRSRLFFRRALIVAGLIAVALAGAGVFGGPTASPADAQVVDINMSSCDLEPFSVDGDATPDCDLDPMPAGTDGCDENRRFFGEQPYQVNLASVGDPSFSCYNLAIVVCADSDVANVEVLGTLTDYPNSTVTGSIEVDGDRASFFDLNASEFDDPYAEASALFFRAVLTGAPIGGTLTVTLEGQFAGTFEVDPTFTCGLSPAGTVDFDVTPDCAGFIVQAEGDFTVESADDVQIGVRFTPFGGGDALEYGPFDAGFVDAGMWSYAQLFNDGIEQGRYLATVTARGSDLDGGDFDEMSDAFDVTRPDCVDVTAECNGFPGSITATPTTAPEAAAALATDAVVTFSGLDEQDNEAAVAEVVTGGTTLTFDLDAFFDAPGTISWTVFQEVNEGLPRIWETGRVFCLELLPEYSCSAGRGLLTATPVDSSNEALNSLRALANLTVTVDGVAAEPDLSDFSFLYEQPPTSIVNPQFTLEALEPGLLDNVLVEIYYVSDISVDMPTTCQVDFAYDCVNGERVFTSDLTGTPTGTVVVTSDDGTEPPGTELTFTVDNGVIFVENGVGAPDPEQLTRNKLDCDVNVDVRCAAGIAEVQISPFETDPMGNTGRPPLFGGFYINGVPGFQPGNYPVADITDLGTVTVEDPSDRVLIEPDGEMDAPDCIVEVQVECANGEAVLTARPGDTGASVLEIGDQAGDPPRGISVPLDDPGEFPVVLVPDFVDDDNTVLVAIPELISDAGIENSQLAINDPTGDSPNWTWLEDEDGIRFDRARFDVPTCVVSPDAVCGAGDGGLTGRAQFRIDLDGTPAGTVVELDGAEISDFADLEGAPYNVEPGSTITVTTNNGVWLLRLLTPVPSLEIRVPRCTITIDAQASCANGIAVAEISGSDGSFTQVNNATESPRSFETAFSETLTFLASGDPIEVVPNFSEPRAFYVATVDGLAATRGSSGTPIAVEPYECQIDPQVVCGQGDTLGEAIFEVSLDQTPPGTEVTTAQLADTSAPLPAGSSVTFGVSNGVVFSSTNIDELTISPVPFCTVRLDVEPICAAGQPLAEVTTTSGSYDVAAQGGSVFAPEPPNNSNNAGNIQASGAILVGTVSSTQTFSFDSPDIPMAVRLTNLAPAGAIVVDNDDNQIDPSQGVTVSAARCVADPVIECVNGAPNLAVDTSDLPAAATVTPSDGTAVVPGQPTTIWATNGVFVRDIPSSQIGASITVDPPVCQVAATLVCQTGDGGPAGSAVLSTTVAASVPPGTAVTPAAGETVASESTLTVTVNNGVHFNGSDMASIQLRAPACVVTATSTVECANGGIVVTVTTTGAQAAEIIINGDSFAANPDDNVTVVRGLAPLPSYDIALVAAEPAQVAVGATESVPLGVADRCQIELTGNAACVSGTQVLVTVAPTDASTGTVQSISVNNDPNLPLLVTPGTAATIVVTSSDTLPGDITIPTISVPSACTSTVAEPGGTLFVDYTLACDSAGEQVVVDLNTEGSAGVLALSVNGDGAAPYLVAQGEPIVVSVLTFLGNDTVLIDGPAQAPVCIAPPTPTVLPIPTPEPAVLVVFDPDPVIIPLATPESNPTPTPTATTEPTVTPAPTATPEPTAEPTPTQPSEPGPQPDPEPEAAPEQEPESRADEVLSLSASVRQHGRSTVSLPAVCDVDDISLPGAVRFTRDGVDDEGNARFVVETVTLDVGTYTETISCGGEQIEVELFVYRQIGGARGEASSISRLAVTGGILTLVLVGIPGLVGRREQGIGLS